MRRLCPVIMAALALCLFAGSVYAGGEPVTSKGGRQLVFRTRDRTQLAILQLGGSSRAMPVTGGSDRPGL